MNANKPGSSSLPGALLFALVCIPFLPVMAAGYVIWIIALFAGRKSEVSATAQGPLVSRWILHKLGSRLDEPACRMLEAITGFYLPLTLYPVILASRVSGYAPPAFRYPFAGEINLGNQGIARQTIYDEVVREHLPGRQQFVILGSGFDTRALNLPRDSDIRSYEIDTPATISAKQNLLARTGINASGVTFVSADFEAEDWLARLMEAGFDPRLPSLFLLEGVTPYLERGAVEETLRKIAASARGSLVAFDFFTSEVLESSSPLMRSLRASLKAGGEPLKFGLDSTPPQRDRVIELLQTCGLALVEQRSAGPETGGRRAWGGFAVAVVD